MDDQREPIISIRGLVNRFGRQVVHDHLDLDVRRDEILGVVGGSGAGKSVLLRSILGLHGPNEGTIKVLGHRYTVLLQLGVGALQQGLLGQLRNPGGLGVLRDRLRPSLRRRVPRRVPGSRGRPAQATLVAQAKHLVLGWPAQVRIHE